MTQAPEFRLVPVEPTEAMLSAIDMTHACEPIDQWRAAIAAAPHTAAPDADRAVSEPGEYMLTDDAFDALQEQFDCFADEGREGRLREFADACYSAGWNDGETPATPPADRAELAEKAKRRARTALRAAFVAGHNLRTDETYADEEDEAMDAIDALARSTDAPSEPVEVLPSLRAEADALTAAYSRGHADAIEQMRMQVFLAAPPAAATSTPCASGDRAAFWPWLARAYRDGVKDVNTPKFTAHNMEVAFNAGLAATQAPAVPATKPLKHSTKDTGDCPHWCRACAVEAAERSRTPTAGNTEDARSMGAPPAWWQERAMTLALLAHGATRALDAWDTSPLPKSNDGRMQEAMEELRVTLTQAASTGRAAE